MTSFGRNLALALSLILASGPPSPVGARDAELMLSVSSAPFGSFLASLGGSSSPPQFPSAAALSVPLQLGDGTLVGYRFIEGGFRGWRPRDLSGQIAKAEQGFAAECRGNGGSTSPYDRRSDIYDRFLGNGRPIGGGAMYRPRFASMPTILRARFSPA